MHIILFAATLLFSIMTLSAQELSAADNKILQKVLAYHNDNKECTDRDSEMEASQFVKFKGEYGDTNVVLVTCSFHAYQVSWVAYSAAGDADYLDISILSFPSTIDGKRWTASKFLMSPEWVAGSGALQTFYKGRGVGDCGGYDVFRWKDGAFYLVRANHQVCCGDEQDFETRLACKKIKDVYPVGVDNWPLVYEFKGD